MRYRYLIAVAIACSLALLSCNFFKHNKTIAKADKPITFPLLPEGDIFNTTAIRNFGKRGYDAQTYSRKQYLLAIDMLANKKDAAGSIPLFVTSLRADPDAFTYLKLGDAYYALHNYDTALLAYDVARYTNNGSLNAEVIFAQARTYAMKNDTSQTIYSIESLADEKTISADMVNKEKAFDFIRNTETYRIAISKFVTDENERRKAMLASFVTNFPVKTFPFAMPLDSLTRNNNQVIDYRYAEVFPDLLQGQFGRDVSKTYEFVASFNVSPNFNTLLIRGIDVNADTLQPVNYTLVNIDTGANIVSKQIIACYCSPLTLRSCTINTKGVIEVKEIAQTWKEDPLTYGYQNNQVDKQEIKHVKYYTIAPNGSFTEMQGGDSQAQNSNN